MTVTHIHTREADKADNERSEAAIQFANAPMVEARGRVACFEIQNLRERLFQLVHENARDCPHIDADDEMQTIDDCLQDMIGDTIGRWNQYADRMRREAKGGY